MPGAGKTILAATAIHHLQQQIPENAQDVAVVWVYCKFQERVSQTTTNVLGSIAAQLVSRRQDLTDSALTIRRKDSSSTAANLADIKKLLVQCTQKYTKVYLVVDALDEYSEDNLGWTDLITEIEALGSHFSIMITARPIAAIENHFSTASRLEVAARELDGRLYVRSLLKRPEFQKHLRNDDTLRQHIENKLTEKANGM